MSVVVPVLDPVDVDSVDPVLVPVDVVPVEVEPVEPVELLVLPLVSVVSVVLLVPVVLVPVVVLVPAVVPVDVVGVDPVGSTLVLAVVSLELVCVVASVVSGELGLQAEDAATRHQAPTASRMTPRRAISIILQAASRPVCGRAGVVAEGVLRPLRSELLVVVHG
ncbi:hypothetical protein [Nannocystis radixulma]|uniref:Uncharacterized protein n=1 Tax=Nannocystis radixulma TaxID=2995305 RepID=A0ABT5B1S5_9BACT|nr:hypothetical protein [Nannocystis radixulma]MDC0668057.1 hypothetical protein [Nannocystis radixulma]